MYRYEPDREKRRKARQLKKQQHDAAADRDDPIFEHEREIMGPLLRPKANAHEPRVQAADGLRFIAHAIRTLSHKSTFGRDADGSWFHEGAADSILIASQDVRKILDTLPLEKGLSGRVRHMLVVVDRLMEPIEDGTAAHLVRVSGGQPTDEYWRRFHFDVADAEVFEELVYLADAVMAAVDTAGTDVKLSPTEQCLVQALREHGKRLTGEKLSHKAVNRHDGETKTALATLVRRGIIDNKPKNQADPHGYGFPEWS